MQPLPSSLLKVLFSTATAASFAAVQMRESEALVRQKDVDLANLAELSEYIVQHLRESLLVVDAADKIEAFLPELDRMVKEGLVTLERAEVLIYRGPDKPRG